MTDTHRTINNAGLATGAARSSLLTICCSFSSLVAIALVVTISLLPLYLSRKGDDIGVDSTTEEKRLFHTIFAIDLANFESQSITKFDSISTQINRYLGYPSNTLKVRSVSFIPGEPISTRNHIKKRQTRSEISCDIGSKLDIELFVNACSSTKCHTSYCFGKCIPEIKLKITTVFDSTPSAVTITTANGTDFSILLRFCSFGQVNSGATPVVLPSEVHYTLIIDTIFPYTESRKPIISANYSYPGPLIEAFENDTLVIRLINRLDGPSTMHWHGLSQIGTPDMDGAVGITQCAIPPQYETVYRFKASPAGTVWYHGHLLEQYTDGLFGPMIIRRRNEPNKEFYDSEQILMIADWYNNRAHIDLLPMYLSPNNPDGNEPTPDAIVVNGKFTRSLFITVAGSTRIRFRIINTAAFSMYTVSIDGLPLHIIEVDSTVTSPYTVGSFSINVGQRVSFYIDLKELDSIYTLTNTTSLYIRIQVDVSMYPVDIVSSIPSYEDQPSSYPTMFNPLYLAIVSLDSNNSLPAYAASDATPVVSNIISSNDTNLLDARPYEKNTGGIPNATHYLNLVIVFDIGADGINHPYINNVTYSSDANYMHMTVDQERGITSDFYAPLLHQMAEKPDALLIPSPRIEASNQLPTIQSDGYGHYLVPYKAVVDIVLNNTDDGEHPFHLHGYNFWIIATSDYPEAETLYANDYLSRDTVSIPASGWAKIRFLADNPGAWFFHCHIEWHMSAGLAMTLIVSPEELLARGYRVTSSQKELCQALEEFERKNQTKFN